MKTRRKLAFFGCGILLTALTLSSCMPLPVVPEVPTESSTEPTQAIPPNLYTPEDFYFDGAYLACSAAQTVMGIDVSHHQQKIDWLQVKEAGVEFVMVRLGNRSIASGALNIDSYALQNLQGARDAGLKVGAYFYSQALNIQEAQEEAALALQILDGFRLDMPLAYDWEQEERTKDVDARTLTDCTLAFCEVVEKAGYRPMVYFNSYQAQELLHLSELTHLPWWLAMYDVTMDFPYRMDMWQYTCTGTIAGIEGNVDINLLFADGV